MGTLGQWPLSQGLLESQVLFWSCKLVQGQGV